MKGKVYSFLYYNSSPCPESGYHVPGSRKTFSSDDLICPDLTSVPSAVYLYTSLLLQVPIDAQERDLLPHWSSSNQLISLISAPSSQKCYNLIIPCTRHKPLFLYTSGSSDSVDSNEVPSLASSQGFFPATPSLTTLYSQLLPSPPTFTTLLPLGTISMQPTP